MHLNPSLPVVLLIEIRFTYTVIYNFPITFITVSGNLFGFARLYLLYCKNLTDTASLYVACHNILKIKNLFNFINLFVCFHVQGAIYKLIYFT